AVCQQGSLNCTELNSEIKVTVVRWREKRERESDREGGKKEKRYGSQTSMECVGERKRKIQREEEVERERERERDESESQSTMEVCQASVWSVHFSVREVSPSPLTTRGVNVQSK